MMVRPAAFGFHAEAAASNAFAEASANPEIPRLAQVEFDGLHRALADAGVEVLVLPDLPDPPKPDSVFPNNWVSFHADRSIILYPMATAARRLERDEARLRDLVERAGFAVSRIIDLSHHEADGRHLEGTGSLILDRPRRRAFASLSARTDKSLIEEFDRATGYSTFAFRSRDRSGGAIYHTNVLLSLGAHFAILCPDAVEPDDLPALQSAIADGGREVIAVSFDQMEQFACNIIELEGKGGPVIAMSEAARSSLNSDQRRALERYGSLVAAPIPTIEAVGGGSVRCMIADVHLPRMA